MILRTFESALELYFRQHPEMREEFEQEFEKQMQGWANDLDQDDQARRWLCDD